RSPVPTWPRLVLSFAVINFGSIEPGLVIIKRKPGDNDCVHAQRFRPAHLATRCLDRWQVDAGQFVAVCVHLRDKDRIGGTSCDWCGENVTKSHLDKRYHM